MDQVKFQEEVDKIKQDKKTMQWLQDELKDYYFLAMTEKELNRVPLGKVWAYMALQWVDNEVIVAKKRYY